MKLHTMVAPTKITQNTGASLMMVSGETARKTAPKVFTTVVLFYNFLDDKGTDTDHPEGIYKTIY